MIWTMPTNKLKIRNEVTLGRVEGAKPKRTPRQLITRTNSPNNKPATMAPMPQAAIIQQIFFMP